MKKINKMMWNNLNVCSRPNYPALQKGFIKLKEVKGPSFTGFFNFNIHGLMCHFLMVLLFGCSRDYHQNLSVYRMLDASLNSSRTALTGINNELINSVGLNFTDSLTRSKMAYWLPKMKVIHQRSIAVISFMDSLKLRLKLEAGLKLSGGKEVFAEEDYKAVSTLFGKEGKGRELREKLLNFKNVLMAIDPQMNDLVNNLFMTTARLKDPMEKTSKTFEETFFKNVPAVGSIAILSKFQNEVTVIEYQLLLFCRDQLSA